jgi:hypothetical protein
LRLQARVQKRLQALGVAVLPHHPPRTRAERVRAALGARGAALATLLDDLDRQRYALKAASGSIPPGWWRAFAAAARGVPRATPADNAPHD